jgi:hypothetical protein
MGSGAGSTKAPQHRVARAIVLSDVQSDAILGGKKGLNRPVPSVALMPDGPTVLKFEEGVADPAGQSPPPRRSCRVTLGR